MLSIRSPNRRLILAQWGLILVSVALGVVHWLEPEHSLHIENLQQWERMLTGDIQPNLQPRAETIAGAKALVDYGSFQFVGCDLALSGWTMSLVTNWRGVSSASPMTLSVRFVLPGSYRDVRVDRPLSGEAVTIDLPVQFYVDGARGQIWLCVLDVSGQLLSVQRSLQPNADGWSRVCN